MIRLLPNSNGSAEIGLPMAARSFARRRLLIRVLIATLADMLAACSSVRTRTVDRGEVIMTREEFAAHVEHVFRYHNQVMNDWITLSADFLDEADDNDAVTDAEEAMDEACEPLNEIVAAEAVAEEANFWTKRKLPQAVPECEAATLRLETLLREAFKTRKKIQLHDFPADDPE